MHLSVIREKDHSGTIVNFFITRKLHRFHAIFVLISCFNLVLFGYMPPVNPYIIYSFNKFQNSKLRTPQFIKVHASTWSIVLHYKTYTTDNSLYLPKYTTVCTYLNTKVCRIYTSIKNYIWSFLFLSVSAWRKCK